MDSLRKGIACTLLVIIAVVTCVAAKAAASERHPAKQRVAASPRRIVCGMTGCFDVPPGCGYEMRAAGRGGVVAVILCDRAR